MSIKAELTSLAKTLGFDECRVTPATRAPHADAFLAWLADDRHGEMAWLARDPERRTDPRRVLDGAESVVVLAVNYHQGPSTRQLPGRFARYAWGKDYHDSLVPKLRTLAELLRTHGGEQKWYADTGPVLERDFAAEAGVGWQGKSTLCLNERLGTWFFLAVILTTLRLEADAPAKARCGSCRRCLDACPTGALTAPGHLDARRCIAYLTIEHPGTIPEPLRTAIGDRVYGCDDCLDACPWNRFAQVSREMTFQAIPAVRDLSLRELAELSEEDFRLRFRGSPIKRLKWRRLMRNVSVALGNVGTAEDLPALARLAQHPDPLVAEHAQWGMRQIETRERAIVPFEDATGARMPPVIVGCDLPNDGVTRTLRP